MKLYFFLMAILPMFVFGQTEKNITGFIYNKLNQPVASARITLLAADSSVVIETASDSLGMFIAQPIKEMIFIRVAKEGFQTEWQRITNKRNYNFLLLDLSHHVLKEVTLTTKKSLVEYHADKTVVNVENSIGASTGDALDAIKKAPGVLVGNNEINIVGKSAVSIMINGKLQQIGGDDLIQWLHSIPSSTIAKIEVITSPSSKYDAQGDAGIINLVLKKHKQNGFKGSTTLTYQYNTKYLFPNLSTNLNYKRNNLTLFGNVSAGTRGWPYTGYINSYFTEQKQVMIENGLYKNQNARFQLGGDIVLSKKSTIGAMVSNNISKVRNDEHFETFFYTRDAIDSTTLIKGESRDIFPTKFSANTNYEYRLDSLGKKIGIDLDYYFQQGNRTRDFNIDYLHSNSQLDYSEAYRTSSQPISSIISGKIDAELPFKKFKANLGIKLSKSFHVMDNNFELLKTDHYELDTDRSNQFRYREQIQAAYLSLAKQWKHLDVQIGVRGERTIGEGVSNRTLQSRKFDYIKLFPSASLRYNLTKDQVVNLSFTRRINRPDYSFFNPLKYFHSPASYTVGNPLLQPSFIYASEMGYTFQSNWNIKLFYSYTANYYDRIYTVDTILQANSVTRKNLGTRTTKGISISGSIKPLKKWELNWSLNGAANYFKANENFGSSDFSGLNWWTEISNMFVFNKQSTFLGEINGYYYSGRQKDFVFWAPMSSVSLGIRYLLFKKNLSVSLFAEDIFRKSYWLQTNLQNNTKEYSYDGNPIRFSVSYKFGNSNIKSKQLKTVEEIQRTN
ncbi:MAG: TonB-dependent receptor [Chitinophagaceae bacterium]|nr:TonB-dependent receptor [Chitinophagaceae bacterium]